MEEEPFQAKGIDESWAPEERRVPPRSATGPPRSATEDLEDLLRSRGHRMSLPRRLVLIALFAAERPVTAEEIAAGVDGRVPASEITSIYRNLEMLEQQGLVYHMHLGHGPRHYRLVSPDEPCYLVCERCERVDTVPFSDLDDARSAVSNRVGYRATFTHFPIVGLCPACAATASAPAPPRSD